MRHVVVLVMLAACGFRATPSVAGADAGGDAPIDASFPACREFATAGITLPAHVTGAVAGADIEAPAQCASVDAPYGIESAGPDSVVRLDGLIAGATYVVRLNATSDLAFYVVTGCSTATGPAPAECVLFEDASATGEELGTFVATAPTSYVVVDDYSSYAPADPSFTLDVYAEACVTAAQCGGATPVCEDGQCVECASSFDCRDAQRPRCDDVTDTCMPGVDDCLSDDPAEPGDDGPAGATVLALDPAGKAAANGQICSAPSSEADFIAFDVATLGETWDVSLAWTGGSDLDLELYDATGQLLGLSYWEQPEHARLTYLAVGRYYAKVSEFSSSPDASPVPYTISVHRMLGVGCASAADCASEYRNQLYRGDCQAGACVSIDGAALVAEGGACDSQSDCATGLSCPSFFFVANADTREVCGRACAGDGDCATGDVCTTYLVDNFCVQACTTDLQCPTAPATPPATGPWYRLTCDIATGHCLP